MRRVKRKPQTAPGLFDYGKTPARLAPKQAPAAHKGSHLEEKFKFLWRQAGGGGLAREYKFHPVRQWRADFAHVESRTLIEIEGGRFVQGRHNSPQGFADDCEKYLEAVLHGWRVIRLCDVQLTGEIVGRIQALTCF